MNLAAWMIEDGLDDDALAERAKVTRATISRIRRGKALPSPALARVFIGLSCGRVTLNELFGVYDLPPLPADSGEASTVKCERAA